MTTTAPPRPAERHGFRIPLATGPAAAGEARRRVRAAIRSWPVPVEEDVALLLTSELVTNAVRHEPGQAVMLVIHCSSDGLRVDVHDTSRSWPAVADVPAARPLSALGTSALGTSALGTSASGTLPPA